MNIYVCTDKQRSPTGSCGTKVNAKRLVRYMRRRLRNSKALLGGSAVNVRGVGCMLRCSKGPVMVMQPDCAWFHYENKEDIEQLISEYVIKGRMVYRLRVSKYPDEGGVAEEVADWPPDM